MQAYFHWFNYLRAGAGSGERAQDAATTRKPPAPPNDVQREYLRHNTDIKMLHAMCEDYRASASIDLKIDEADIKAGKKIQCPLLTLWAATGAMGKLYDVLGIWKDEGVNVTGKGFLRQPLAPGKRSQGNAGGVAGLPSRVNVCERPR